MKGICNLFAIPIRKQPSSTSEMVSQLLFGDTYRILEHQGAWVAIVTDYDNYSGFINEQQLCMLTDTDANTTWQVNTTYPFLTIQTDSGNLFVPAGGNIPVTTPFQIGTTSYTNLQEQFTYNQTHISQIANQYLHVPYLWGGKTPFGIDCSGFTQMVFKQCGLGLLRDAYQQAEQGIAVDFVEETQPGDLAFFDNLEGRITHVGIMLANQQIIHASGKVRIDVLDHYGIMNHDTGQYSHKLRIIKRLF